MAPLLSQPFGVARAADYLVTMTPMGLVVPLVAALAIAATLLGQRRSRFGRHWRAFADDPVAAALLGIDPARILTLTMVFAAALAGLGGLLTTFYYGGVGLGGGLAVGLKALIAAVIGGIGSVRGAVLGALVLGVAETAWVVAFPIEYRDPLAFVLLALLLAVRPQGLFGDTTR
jgi:branched-subunit amino acid ABC-type transport system permease component